jgi:hypothetical protein
LGKAATLQAKEEGLAWGATDSGGLGGRKRFQRCGRIRFPKTGALPQRGSGKANGLISEAVLNPQSYLPYTLNDDPHPQVLFTFGFSNLNPAPSRVST